MNKLLTKRAALAALAFLLAFALIALVSAITNGPPCTGTVTEKTVYPAYYDVTTCNPSRELAYCIGIEDKSGMAWYSWYVDESTYNRYEVGDTVNRLGLITRAGRKESSP